MNMNIMKFDILSATEDAWESFFRVMEELNRETDPEEPQLPRKQRKAMLISSASNPYRRVHRFLIYTEEEPREAAGCAAVSVETSQSPSFETNKHLGTLNLLFISKKYRRKGLGALLLKRVIEELAAKEPAVSEFLSPVFLEPGAHFLDRQGGTVSLETAENRLNLNDLDWVMVEAWAAGSARRNPGTTVMTVSVVPVEDIESFSEAYAETINQQPLGDVAIEMKYTPEQIRFDERKCQELGVLKTTMYLKAGDGKVIGLTEIFYDKEAGHKVTQMLTGVKDACRGQGLGKLLKARMLLHIRKEYPGVKYLVTANADSNAAMLVINNKLGFKRHLPIKLYKLKINARAGSAS